MFRLAAQLGLTVKELAARIDSRELSEWMAYYNIEPFGERMMDMRFAQLSHLTAVAQGVTIAGRKPSPEDFMPRYNAQKQSDEEIALKIELWMRALGGK